MIGWSHCSLTVPLYWLCVVLHFQMSLIDLVEASFRPSNGALLSQYAHSSRYARSSAQPSSERQDAWEKRLSWRLEAVNG